MKKILILFLLSSMTSFGQGPCNSPNPPSWCNGGGGPCAGNNPPSWCNNTSVPINDGIVYLLIGGLLYGFKKMYDLQKISN